jgi:hypothetical protein
MSIDYALYQNKLTEETDLYAAKVLITTSADLETIADRIVEQGSTVTRTDVIAVLEGAVIACENLLLEGARVNFGGLFDAFPKIKGKFNGITDHYDPSRHQVDVGAAPGSRVRKTVRENAAVSKLETILPRPLVLEYVDLGTGETNNHITAGNIGTINGNRLAFDPNADDEGIYLVGEAGADTVKVTEIQKNKPSELVFMVPALAERTYWLQVRRRFTPEGDLRTGQLDTILSITEAMAEVAV